MPIDLAGNSLGTARSLTIGSSTQTFTDWVGSSDTNDFYRFSLSSRSSFNLSLSGLAADADVALIRDLNNNGIVDSGETIASSTAAGITSDYINSTLDAGTYYIRVYPFSGETYYNLGVSATIPDNAGNTLSTARQITLGSTTSTYTDWVGSTDTNDFYRFTLTNRSNFNLSLSGLAADADVALIRDLNNNGIVDSGETIASSTAAGITSDYINSTLDAGTYYIRVYPFSGQTSYNLGVSATIPDNAGNTLSTARQITLGSTTSTYTDWVGSTDTNDYYRFTLGSRSNFNLSLNGLSADADVHLLDSSGNIIQSSANGGTTAESIARILDAGTYYVRVYPFGSANTYYNLGLSSQVVQSGNNTLGTAEIINSATFSRNGQVNAGDGNDFYRFSVSQSGVFTANLTGLSGDADVRLIQDSNNNGLIDQGEVMAWQWERGATSESIRRFLNTGTYFLQVMSYNNQTANYSVGTNFTAAASDDRRFSIQINFGVGSSALSQAMRNAVQEAARFWENVISYSSFNSSHMLTIDVGGTVQQWSNGGGVLASAGPRSVQQDGSQRWMPTTGISNINSNPDAVSYLSSNIDFFRRVMIHEFGHVLGIGTFWGSGSYARNLVNQTTGTYNANTYAGWAYGELRGTYTQTAIPVTTGVGSGSDYAHWREQVFDSELMTHQAEAPGQSMPLSQLTIASLRDLGWNVNYGAAEAYSLPA